MVDLDPNKFQCSISKKRVHLRCTLLPPYQPATTLTHVWENRKFYVYLRKLRKYLQKVSKREPNEMFQEKYEKELERFCNFNKEIATLIKKNLRNKENELDTVTIHNH